VFGSQRRLCPGQLGHSLMARAGLMFT
jgi:hypothetical protein